MPDASLNEAARRTPLLAETEVLVLGGGPAGIAAAAGREVLLVERRGCLGGIDVAALQAGLEPQGAYLGRDIE